MSTEPAKPIKKKSFISIPFVIVGLGLLAMILPVFPDIDQKGEADPSKRKRDSISKYVMFKVMRSQEKVKSNSNATKNNKAPNSVPDITRLSSEIGRVGQPKRPPMDDED